MDEFTRGYQGSGTFLGGPGSSNFRKRKTIADRGYLPDGTKANSPEEAQLALLVPQRDAAAVALAKAQDSFEALDAKVKAIQLRLGASVEPPSRKKKSKPVEAEAIKEPEAD